jgi:hypothetical protein
MTLENAVQIQKIESNSKVRPIHNQTEASCLIQRVMHEEDLKTRATRINPAFRWRSSSLKPVIKAAKSYRKQKSPRRLLKITEAIDQMPLEKAKTYATLLQELQNEIVKEEIKHNKHPNNSNVPLGPIWGGDLQQLLDQIAGLSVWERRAYRDNDSVRSEIAKRQPNEAVVIIGALLTGSLEYTQLHTGEDMFFNLFVRDRRDAELPDNALLNCWEFIMYSARLTGSLSADQIFNYYRAENRMGLEHSYSVLGWNEDLPQYGENGMPQPEPGDLLFVRELANLQSARQKLPGGKPPGHVIMYSGGGQALSHDAGQGNLAERVDINTKWPPDHYRLQFCTPQWLR